VELSEMEVDTQIDAETQNESELRSLMMNPQKYK
jgi:hypothetical protein